MGLMLKYILFFLFGIICFVIGRIYFIRWHRMKNVRISIPYFFNEFHVLDKDYQPIFLEVNLKLVLDKWNYRYKAVSIDRCKEIINNIIANELRGIAITNNKEYWFREENVNQLRKNIQKRFYDYFEFELYKFPYLFMIKDIDVRYIPHYSFTDFK